MEWKKNLESAINLIAEAKKNHNVRVNNEGNPEHDIEEKVMSVEALGDISPKTFPLNYFHVYNKKIASLDSSSRYLRDLSVNTCLVGLAIFSNVKRFIDGPIDIKTPYMAISSYSSLLKDIENKLPSNLIRVKNRIDYYYVNEPGNEYKIDDIADEIRTEAENLGLKEVIKDHDYVILDGPIYPTPLELTEGFPLETETRKMHRVAYASLVSERIQSLNDKVVSVVKRLENSRKIFSVDEVKKIVGDVNARDVTILEIIDEKYCKQKSSYICLIGPFKIQYKLKVEHEGKVVLDNVPPKYSYYVIIRLNKDLSPNFLRIESISEKMVEEPENNEYLHIVLSSISLKTLLPSYIELVDKESKRVTRSLFIYAYEFSSGKLNIIHDDKLTYIKDKSEQVLEGEL